MIRESNKVQIKESLVLDKWEGEADAPGSKIVERLWIEDGSIVGVQVATENAPINPFDAKEDPPKPPPKPPSPKS